MAKKGLFSIFGKSSKKKAKHEDKEEIEQLTKSVMSGYRGEETEESPQKYIKTDEVGGRTRQMIIDYLHLNTDDASDIDKLAKPEDIANVEFTVSVPSGLDSDEVSDFCDEMEAYTRKYRELVNSLIKDKNALIDEVLRVDGKAMEQRQNNLIGMQDDNQDKTNKLQDRVVKLQFQLQKFESENKKLRTQLKSGTVSSDDINALNNENQSLKQQLETTKRQIDAAATQQAQDTANKLKALSAENASLKAELTQAQSTHDDAVEIKVEELTNKLKAKDDEITKLRNNTSDKLLSELEATKKKLAEALDVRNIATRDGDDSKLIASLKSQIIELQSNLELATRAANRPESNDGRKLKQENEKLKAQLSKKNEGQSATVSLNAQIASLKSQLKAAQLETITVKRSSDSKQKELQAKINTLNSKVTNTQPELAKKVQTLQKELAEEKRVIEKKENKPLPTNNPSEFLDSDEYEKTVMAQFKNKKSLKHVKKTLSPADIKRMQEGEQRATLSLNSSNKPQQKSNNVQSASDIHKDNSGSSFDNLFDEMNED